METDSQFPRGPGFFFGPLYKMTLTARRSVVSDLETSQVSVLRCSVILVVQVIFRFTSQSHENVVEAVRP
jgi:hypothetical protein